MKTCATKLTKAEKKALRKQTRLIHSLRRNNSELAIVSESPTRHLMVGNGGFMCGIDRKLIFNFFQKFGNIERLLMFPGRSFSFITFEHVSESLKAMEKVHGRVLDCPSEFPRPDVRFYLSFLTNLPDDVSFEKQATPSGLVLVDDFVTEAEEEQLIQVLGWGSEGNEVEIQGTANQELRHRRVKHFGYEFLYRSNNVDKSNPLPDGFPGVCDVLLDRVQEKVMFKPDQMTVNEYKPGQGIPPHIDTHSAFEDGIVSLSLGSQVTMEFRHPDGRHVPVVLPRRSLLVMTGESRYLWSHGITPRKYDIIHDAKSTSNEGTGYVKISKEPETVIAEGTHNKRAEEGTTLFERQTRISLTLRKVRHTPCDCAFSAQCDSQTGSKTAPELSPPSSVPTTIGEAQNLEKLHVHEVYEKIAPHFSGTRHSPWPKVADFLRNQPVGSLVADVGCGNGKYLGINDNLFKTGSDRSFNLASICRERGYSVIVCDILSLPYRTDVFDVCLCIAVLHHLATAERRLVGLKELVRITRPGGLVLVYVWALEQEVKKVKKKHLKEVDFTESNNHRTEQENLSNKNEFLKESKTIENFPSNNEPSPNKSETLDHNCSSRLMVNASRDSFEQQDLFVPWKYSGPGKQHEKRRKDAEGSGEGTEGHVYHRYYHVFQDGELRNLCSRLSNVTLEEHYYDRGNWCVMLRKSK
ncbi:alkylated DNA repair protein alkB homolog 8-like [Stylophora pistillata]|nr:alkylated DNA repair protein alkB homolog 8-like [Stylophora pistillata]